MIDDQEKFISYFAETLREQKRMKIQQRMVAKNSYEAGRITRLTADWPTTIYSPTSVLRMGLRSMRAHSRELDLNNDYARKFHWMVGMNVGGPKGVGLQNKAMMLVPDRDRPGKFKQILDKIGNDKIEAAWMEFNKNVIS